MSVRVRFAPSPTGPLHIGGVRTALYNYLFAKKNKGVFVLRIEDTDQERYVEGAEDYIINALKWLGIDPDEGPNSEKKHGPYRQSDRKDLYIKHIEAILSSEMAYIAFDTPDELQALRKEAELCGETFIYNWNNREKLRNSLTLSKKDCESLVRNKTPYVVRFKTHALGEEETISLHDAVRGEIMVNKSLLDDKILVKQDGMPTYHFANIVDDHLMEISHVIRGEEWLPSMPLHVLLYKAFGWEAPIFAHVPLILKPSGKGKLSKRDGDALGFPVFPLQWGENTVGFKEAGYIPEALINYLALLGWSPGGEVELFTIEELIGAFSLNNITKSGGRFDPERCKWFNQQYAHQLPIPELAGILKQVLDRKNINVNTVSLETVSGLIRNRITLLTDIWDEASLFFVAPKDYDEKAVRKQWKEETPDILRGVINVLEQNAGANAEALSEEVKKWAASEEIRIGMLMAPLRLALVGSMRGPDVFEISNALGADESVKRINAALTTIKQ